jgi:hypothetical protein
MTTPVGGLRHRFLRDSVFNYVSTNVVALGWTGTTNWHQPVVIVPDAVTDLSTIQTNTLALADEDLDENEAEFGSNFAEHVWTAYWDVYAESDTIGGALIHDVRDILRGRFGGQIVSAGNGPTIQVFDYSVSPPNPIFTVDVTRTRVAKSPTFSHKWARCWYSLDLQITDYYGDGS